MVQAAPGRGAAVREGDGPADVRDAGTGCAPARPLLLDLHARWSSRATTSKVNEVVQAAQRERPTPHAHGQPALRDAGLDRTAVVRDLRRRAAAERRPTSGTSRTGCAGSCALDGVPIRLRFRARGARASLSGAVAADAVGYPVRVGLRFWAATGRGAAWLARLTGGQKVAGSNPAGPTDGHERGDPARGLQSPCADRSQRHLGVPDRA